MTEHEHKKRYTRPEVEDFGTVTELTGAGGSQPGTDFKDGSGPAQGPPHRR